MTSSQVFVDIIISCNLLTVLPLLCFRSSFSIFYSFHIQVLHILLLDLFLIFEFLDVHKNGINFNILFSDFAYVEEHSGLCILVMYSSTLLNLLIKLLVDYFYSMYIILCHL